MYKFKTIPALAGMLFCTFVLRAQTGSEDPQDTYQLHIKRASSPIVLDGLLGEPAWDEAEVAGDFWMKFPRDGERAPKRTEVRMTSAVTEEPEPPRHCMDDMELVSGMD